MHDNNEENKLDIISLISKEFDDNDKFVRSVLEFLKEIGWVSENETGQYKITLEGLKNSLDIYNFE